jgi:sugar phosphate isomerase/epimerase
MPLLRCISSLGCPELSLEDTLALAARHGIDAVELRTLGGSVDLAAYLRSHYGTPQGFAARLHSTDVRVVALDGSLRLMTPANGDREQLVELAEWAEGAAVPRLRVFDGGTTATEEELEFGRVTLHWWRQVRRERGWTVDLMVETHDSLLTAEAIGRFAARLGEVAILWDAHHTWRKSAEDPAVTWQAIRSHVAHVHVKDSIPVPSVRHPYTYVLPGDGGFPIARLLAALRRDAFAGPVSLEWEKMWHPYLPALDEALRVAASRAWW